MTLTDEQRQYVTDGRIGRLATADADGRPHVVPCCYVLYDGAVVTPIDEKPKDTDPSSLRRVTDIQENGRVSLVVDHYRKDWSTLGWVQLRGTARVVRPDEDGHRGGVDALRTKYDQYGTHDLETLPLLWIAIGHTVSWGNLTPDTDCRDGRTG
jgi:PPOX class probable F420-dependent enzyme